MYEKEDAVPLLVLYLKYVDYRTSEDMETD